MGVAAPCKVAIVGAGSMAREHARAFRDVAGVSLAGIYSRTPARAHQLGQEFGIARVYDSIAALHDGSQAHLVIVSVPELSMNAVSRACFAYPWTVLLEKPAGYNLEDGEAIAAHAAGQGTRVYVALNRRQYSSTRAALADVDSRDETRYIRVLDQQDQAAARAAGQPPEVVANWMFANSIHTIDYLRQFGRGDVAEVKVLRPYSAQNPGVVLAEVAFASGDIGLYEGIWNGPGPWAVTVATPKRRWEMRPLEQASFQNRGERVLHPAPLHEWDTVYKAGFRQQAELAVDAARGGATAGLPTIADALETVRLIARIFS